MTTSVPTIPLADTLTTKTPVAVTDVPRDWLNGWNYGSSYFPTTIHEPFTGAWQRNMELGVQNVLAYSAVYRCVTIIANDVGKLRLRLVELTDDNVWEETDSPAFSPVLKKPNSFQTRQDFIKRWMLSKLIKGNAYILKERDNRGIVTSMYVLDPFRVYPYITEDGTIFYEVGGHKLAGVPDGNVRIPASEIIHDRHAPLFHDLCGLSPIIACGISAMQAINSQMAWNKFFANGSTPSGLITAPGIINDKQAKAFKDHWELNYTGPLNVGKVAVLGGGLEYKPMMMNAIDADLVKQLGWTAENVCTAFGVPAYMIGVGSPPNYNNVEAQTQNYYSQCLQDHIESIEAKLDEGLGLETAKDGRTLGTEFNLDDLLRMDTATQIKTLAEGVRSALYEVNEARQKLGLPKTEGGDAAFLQQQNFSLPALAKRDAQENPFAPAGGAQQQAPQAQNDNEEETEEQEQEEATNEQRSIWLSEGANASGA